MNTISSKRGLSIKRSLWLRPLFKNCLANNFTPSAKGWSSPTNVTLLGPNRFWLNPKYLRSNKVTNATAPSLIKTIRTSESLQNKMCISVIARRILASVENTKTTLSSFKATFFQTPSLLMGKGFF